MGWDCVVLLELFDVPGPAGDLSRGPVREAPPAGEGNRLRVAEAPDGDRGRARVRTGGMGSPRLERTVDSVLQTAGRGSDGSMDPLPADGRCDCPLGRN